MVVDWGYALMRRVLAAVFLVAFAAPELHAQQADAARRLMFAPVPLGMPGNFEPELSARPRPASVPLPPARPAKQARPGATANRTAGPRLPKTYLGYTGGGPVALATPQPQSIDLSPRVDLGGVSLGLATGHGNDSGSSGNLLAPEARTPVPTDPTLAPQLDRAKIPYLGLSLSAPTN